MTGVQAGSDERSLPSVDDLLADHNHDGFPDDISGLLIVRQPLDSKTWTAIINLAARLGLGTSGFTPPIASPESLTDRVCVDIRPGDSRAIDQLATSATEDPVPVEASHLPRPDIDLAVPWSISGFLVDRDGDQAADDSAIHLVLPEDTPLEVGCALAELAARIGVECSALTLPLAGEPVPQGRIPLTIEITEDRTPRLVKQRDGSLQLLGAPDELAGFISQLAGSSAGFLQESPGKRAIEFLRRAMAGWNVPGRSARLYQEVVQASSSANQKRFTILEQDTTIRERLHAAALRADPNADVSFPSSRETVVFDHQWTAEWEVDRLLKSLDTEILPKLNANAPVNLIAMVSEPPAVRRRLRGQITRRMLDQGFTQGSVFVLDAFKPGLGWLQEIVLPQLREIDSFDRIQLQFRPWDPEEHDGQIDMSIRWLQELFPADEILARELGLPMDRISLEAVDDLTEIYRVIVIDSGGTNLFVDEFSPLWRRIDYLAGMPETGNVTVTTGGILAEQHGHIRRAHVLTDPEVFWRYVQGELLPHLRRYILASTNSRPSVKDQPLFDDLLIDARISESDEPYGIRQERHSAAEALHEDLYFAVLDFIEELGRHATGEKLSAPGPVRPFVSVRPGRQPEARIRLTQRPEGIARVLSGNQITIVKPRSEMLPVATDIAALEWSANRLVVESEVSSELLAQESFLEALSIECPADRSNIVLRIPTAGGSVEIGIPDDVEPVDGKADAGESIPWDEIISNDAIFSHLRRLSGHASVHLAPVAERSWQGRAIPAVALTSPQSAGIWSLKKLSHFKPTMLIVARHHANEVASTTSALQLIDMLVRQQDRGKLLDSVNVVLLPLENPDGAALHDSLRRENPSWKHHPARYNATGYEFGEDQGNPDSKYGEGRVRDLAWEACLPDVVVDNHGVPSHEWAQLFAGFGSPPRFNVSYWQVQALIYGILPYLEDPAHVRAAEVLRDRVAGRVAEDKDLLRWNRLYAERYSKWGHRWIPERFPMGLFQEMIFHTGPIEPDSPRSLRSYAARYPKTTVVDWVTEVCDETVEGSELERTARAHLLANLAALGLLHDSAEPLQTEAITGPSGVSFRTGRIRPLRVGNSSR